MPRVIVEYSDGSTAVWTVDNVAIREISHILYEEIGLDNETYDPGMMPDRDDR